MYYNCSQCSECGMFVYFPVPVWSVTVPKVTCKKCGEKRDKASTNSDPDRKN